MLSITNTIPEADAVIKGSTKYPNIKGRVSFYGVYGGTIVVAEMMGLPDISKTEKINGTFHGFHIHEGKECIGTADDPFQDAGMHYNPKNLQHPNHAGDLPPLLANRGTAFSIFYTDRFYPEDVIGRTIIVHENADDFQTQPSGNSGAIIALGKIVRE